MQTEKERAVLVQVAIKKVPINDDFEAALISHERYMFGRSSYAPPEAIAYIKSFLPYISYNTLTVFRDDMTSNFKRVDRMNWNVSYRKEWEDFYNAVMAELEKRKEHEEAANNKKPAKRTRKVLSEMA